MQPGTFAPDQRMPRSPRARKGRDRTVSGQLQFNHQNQQVRNRSPDAGKSSVEHNNHTPEVQPCATLETPVHV